MHNSPLAFIIYLLYFKSLQNLNRCELDPCVYDVFYSASALELYPELLTLTPGTLYTYIYMCVCVCVCIYIYIVLKPFFISWLKTWTTDNAHVIIGIRLCLCGHNDHSDIEAVMNSLHLYQRAQVPVSTLPNHKLCHWADGTLKLIPWHSLRI